MTFTFNKQSFRISTETTDETAAKKVLKSTLRNIASGEPVVENPPLEKIYTFDQITKRYVEENLEYKSLSAQIREITYLRNMFPAFVGLDIRDIDFNRISQFKLMRGKSKIAPATINKDLGLMRHIFNISCEEWNLPVNNHLKQIKLERVHKEIE